MKTLLYIVLFLAYMAITFVIYMFVSEAVVYVSASVKLPPAMSNPVVLFCMVQVMLGTLLILATLVSSIGDAVREKRRSRS